MFEKAYQKGLKKVSWMDDNLPDFPHITRGGRWLLSKEGHWTGGFFIGLLWLRYLEAPDEIQKGRILHWIGRIEKRTADNKTHDMGFLFGPSCAFGYRITGNETLFKMARCGADNMMDLFNERSGFILAWDEKGYEGTSIVDTAMNIPLMLWVAEKTGDNKMTETAITAADSILAHNVRPDGSTYHTVVWDEKGHVRGGTHQGYSNESCWSRGQAWALYGFSNMYRYTGDEKYLKASKKLAEYFWEHLDHHFLPRWDFIFQNNDDQPLDCSAAGIGASGMLLLSENLRLLDGAESGIWRERAEAILRALIENALYEEIDKYGIIGKVTVDYPRRSGILESSMYGDYYFMEALYRLKFAGNAEKLGLLY